MATGGENLAQRRRPVWQVGADSIAFVIRELRREGVADPRAGAVVIGHSNGGDMAMLFATEHPGETSVALSLDNRRMPMPRTRHPRVCSIRSSDQAPDPGVVPSIPEQSALRMTIVSVPVRHDDMSDGASEAQKEAMLAVVATCLDRPRAGG